MPFTETDWLGDVPQARNVGGRPGKDYAARGNRKLECPECGFSCRCSAAAVQRAGGFPTCACGAEMIVPNLRDRAVLELDALESEMQRMAPAELTRVCRELGWDLREQRDSSGHLTPDRRSGAGQQRCRWDGGYCSRFASAGGYCREHSHAGAEHYSERRGA